jgi:hypothetical protein
MWELLVGATVVIVLALALGLVVAVVATRDWWDERKRKKAPLTAKQAVHEKLKMSTDEFDALHWEFPEAADPKTGR